MKTYDQLTAEQQIKVVEHETVLLLTDIMEGTIQFDDNRNQDNLQERIDQAIAKANDMQTPWFTHEYIMDTCRDEITGIAQVPAEDLLYRDITDRISDYVI